MNRRILLVLMAAAIAATAVLALPAPRAEAAITCGSEATYVQCGRVFPDPEAGLGTDPNAEGLIPAGDFLQFGNPDLPTGAPVWDGLEFLEARYGRFLEVWRLDELLDNPDALSAGLWLAGERERLPLMMARVTDESVPAAEKRRFVFGLSLHGIERAGVEGGTRALEDLVTYSHCETLGTLEAARADAVCAKQTQVKKGAFEAGVGGFPARLLPWDATSMTMGETLKHAELYFTWNNPDGWHRGDRVGGVQHYQRYNGNGIDPNRDWPTIGWTFRGYTPGSEPETKYFGEALKARGGNWAGGIDLHGQGGAPVLTYTMLPAGANDYAKNQRIREIAQRTQRDGIYRLLWSPLIVDYDESPRAVNTQLGPVGQMLPQRWGTVWDTIAYTTTGSLGDWINSPLGLDAIGMDNEMSLSHITNCGIGSCFASEIEQLHVAGNKGLIYSDVDTTLRTEKIDYTFPFKGRAAYIRYDNRVSKPAGIKGLTTINLPPQEAFKEEMPCGPGASPSAFGQSVSTPTCFSQEFEVKGPADGAWNGGITVNIGFPLTHTANDPTGSQFALERFAEPHNDDAGEWEQVASHYNEGQLYLSNSATITHNLPLPGRYRLAARPTTPGAYTFEVTFTKERAEADPGQLPYDVSNFDFFDDLNKYLPEENRFEALTTEAILADPTVLESYDVVLLVDDPLAGWDESKPGKSELSRAQHNAYYASIKSYVKGGGTLVLLDRAMLAIGEMTKKPELEARDFDSYAGYMNFHNGTETTYTDPLAKGVDVPGAAEGSEGNEENRHQTYEPVPLGFRISAETAGFPDSAPVWGIDAEAFARAGGRVVAQVRSQWAVLGEMKMGAGRIRIGGALLPAPTDEFDHPFGLAPYALTYSGWQVFENLVNVKAQASAPQEPKVLGKKHLPKTGAFPTPLLFVLLLAPAALIARRLRDSYRF